MDCIPDGTDQLSRDYLKTKHILTTDLNSFQYHLPSPVNLLSQRLYEKKVNPFPQAEQCSRMLRLSTTALVMLRLSCLDRVDPSGGAKVFIWKKVGAARRVILPSQRGDLATL